MRMEVRVTPVIYTHINPTQTIVQRARRGFFLGNKPRDGIYQLLILHAFGPSLQQKHHSPWVGIGRYTNCLAQTRVETCDTALE